MGQGIKGALDLTRKVGDGGLELKRKVFVVVTQFRDPDMVVWVRGACRLWERAAYGRAIPGRLGPGGS